MIDEMGFRGQLHSSNPESVMSALGQKQTLGHARAMSALPPKADIGARRSDVRFVPIADILHCGRDCYSITSSARASSDDGTSRPITGERSMKGTPSELAFSARS